MEVRATLQGVRLAPRKVRAVVDVIKKKDALAALDQLDHFVRRPAPAISKLIKSAIANAENTYSMVPSNLYIKEMFVDEGIKLKRYLPRAQGRATELQKKTSRITLVLDERVAGLKQEKTEKEKVKEEKRVHAHDHEKAKPEVAQELGKKAEGGKLKRFFSRKSV